SRRRHTRWPRDWSSDVCSSDLVLRSSHAHALIRSIDSSEAEKLPGVVAVITGEEIRSVMNPITEAYDTAAMGAKQVEWYSLCPRSEERRVGKEGRSGGVREDES